MPRKRKVFVVPRKDGFVVLPPVVNLEFQGSQGDELRLVNKTEEDLIWIVADSRPFGAPVLELVGAGRTSEAHQAAEVESNIFEYQVIMTRSGRKARGNSDPVIIIEN